MRGQHEERRIVTSGHEQENARNVIVCHNGSVSSVKGLG